MIYIRNMFKLYTAIPSVNAWNTTICKTLSIYIKRATIAMLARNLVFLCSLFLHIQKICNSLQLLMNIQYTHQLNQYLLYLKPRSSIFSMKNIHQSIKLTKKNFLYFFHFPSFFFILYTYNTVNEAILTIFG